MYISVTLISVILSIYTSEVGLLDQTVIGFHFFEEPPEVQWLRLSTFIVVTQVQSLVGGLRSHKLHGMPKKIK